MSTLVLDAGPDGVRAAVVRDDGTVGGSAHHDLALVERDGRLELATDDLWRAALAAVREVVDGGGTDRPARMAVTTDPLATVLWDRETLGSPRPAVLAGTLDTLAHVAAREPHTWALVVEGRYAVGGLDSYLVARMTLGTWHVTDATHAAASGLLDEEAGAWSVVACRSAGIPVAALPELVPTSGLVATTEGRAFAGLALPVTGLVARDPAATAADRWRAMAALAAS
ncbi:hypothetical protein KDN32_07425 [Nocardioides sp. J2M5]|uniref:FGGY family carbohydrate kinase n=1 Tax=Nocardioides palaemonis TaxID=2829810 RepID=UPI001BA5757B|nr:FGGY family carbohydrate kinase [Nocardioides palaemonis]MBS2937569.1 hypothetical protein [Nocardioides palaemonis]